MFIRRTSPIVNLHTLRREMDQLMDSFGLGRVAGAIMPPRAFPALNIWEDGESLYAEAELPGVPQDSLEVFVVGNELTIKGTRAPVVDEGASFHRRERTFGEFSRVVTLPAEVNADKVEATLKSGVLFVVLPKAEMARAKRIKVSG